MLSVLTQWNRVAGNHRLGAALFLMAAAGLGCQEDHSQEVNSNEGTGQARVESGAKAEGHPGGVDQEMDRIQMLVASARFDGVRLSVFFGESESGQSPMLITPDEEGVGLASTRWANRGQRTWWVNGEEDQNLGSLEAPKVAYYSQGKITILHDSWDALLYRESSGIEAFVTKVMSQRPSLDEDGRKPTDPR